MPQDKPREKTELQTQGFVSFLCEPGAIEIEAADGGAGDGKPRLPRFSMVAYTGGPNGYTGRNFRDSRAALRFAFQPELEAEFSTIDVGGILSNVANKFLLDGFFSVERTWRNICATRNVSDFKTVTSYRLVGKDQYEQVAPGGELKHGTLGEEQYTNKADTYGLVLSIDRRDIINDDLGAITTVPRKLGRGSGLKINDVFWTTFMNNSSFFAAGNNYYLEGADTVLPGTRAHNQHDYEIDVAVQKKVADQELDPLMRLVEEIADHFRSKRLEAMSNVAWGGTAHSPIYAPEHLEQLGQFTSVLTLTFRTMR